MTASKTHDLSPLDPSAAEPFYRQIYERFRSAIASGLLKPGVPRTLNLRAWR